MTTHSFDFENFNEKCDFSIWQQKMRSILVLQKISKDIEYNLSDNFSKEREEEVDELAYTSIILQLSNVILRKVSKLKITNELWKN